MPMGVENDVPRLNSRGKMLMVCDAVDHEGSVRRVPVLVYEEGFLDDVFKMLWTCASIDQGL